MDTFEMRMQHAQIHDYAISGLKRRFFWPERRVGHMKHAFIVSKQTTGHAHRRGLLQTQLDARTHFWFSKLNHTFNPSLSI